MSFIVMMSCLTGYRKHHVSCFGVNTSEEVEQRQNEGPHHRTLSATGYRKHHVPCYGANTSEEVEQRQNEGPHQNTFSYSLQSFSCPVHFYELLDYKYLLCNVLQQMIGHK
jgi:hypothetical protein